MFECGATFAGKTGREPSLHVPGRVSRTVRQQDRPRWGATPVHITCTKFIFLLLLGSLHASRLLLDTLRKASKLQASFRDIRGVHIGYPGSFWMADGTVKASEPENLCLRCHKEPISYMTLPCRHKTLCTACAARVATGRSSIFK